MLGCSPSDDVSIVLVVSPLIALMIYQVESLHSSGVACVVISDHEVVSQQLLVSQKHLVDHSFCLCPSSYSTHQ